MWFTLRRYRRLDPDHLHYLGALRRGENALHRRGGPYRQGARDHAGGDVRGARKGSARRRRRVTDLLATDGFRHPQQSTRVLGAVVKAVREYLEIGVAILG